MLNVYLISIIMSYELIYKSLKIKTTYYERARNKKNV